MSKQRAQKAMEQFKAWAEAVAYIMEDKTRTVVDRGIVRGYPDVLLSFGYDKANRLGILDDYKRIVLGQAANQDC